MPKVYEMKQGPDGVWRPERVIEKKMPLPPHNRNPKVSQFVHGFRLGFYHVNRVRNLLKNYGLDI